MKPFHRHRCYTNTTTTKTLEDWLNLLFAFQNYNVEGIKRKNIKTNGCWFFPGQKCAIICAVCECYRQLKIAINTFHTCKLCRVTCNRIPTDWTHKKWTFHCRFRSSLALPHSGCFSACSLCLLCVSSLFLFASFHQIRIDDAFQLVVVVAKVKIPAFS